MMNCCIRIEELCIKHEEFCQEERKKTMDRLYHSHVDEKREAKRQADESEVAAARKQARKVRVRPMSDATTERLINKARLEAAERRAAHEKAEHEVMETAALQQVRHLFGDLSSAGMFY